MSQLIKAFLLIPGSLFCRQVPGPVVRPDHALVAPTHEGLGRTRYLL